MSSSTHPLDRDDPRVQAAHAAEHAAYERYGFEPDEHYIEIPDLGLQIRVVEVGAGPPVVLIPGGHGPGSIWIPLLPQLRECTAYVMDWPGGGLSDSIDYRSMPLWQLAAQSTVGLFDQFGLDKASVIGNSMGGLWALRFALEHPDRVSAMAFLGCPAVYPGTSAPFFMRLGSIPGLSGLIVDTMMRSGSPDDAWATLEFLGQPTETIERLPEEFIETWYRMEDLPHFKQTWVGLLQRVLSLWGANSEAAFTTEDLRTYPHRSASSGAVGIRLGASRLDERGLSISRTPSSTRWEWAISPGSTSRRRAGSWFVPSSPNGDDSAPK